MCKSIVNTQAGFFLQASSLGGAADTRVLLLHNVRLHNLMLVLTSDCFCCSFDIMFLVCCLS
jgi:hypothetical protein